MIILPSRIALNGVIGSGKTTLGDLLHARYGVVPVAFADPLKHAARAIFGFSSDDLWGPSARRNTLYKDFVTAGWCFDCGQQCQGPERQISLFKLDDEVEVEKIHSTWDERQDFWECERCGASFPRYATPREALKTLGTNWGRAYCAETWTTRAFSGMSPDKNYVITDCRFDNERRSVKENGGVNILLLRGLAESTTPHPSEAQIREAARDTRNFDATIDNREGSVEENFTKLELALSLLTTVKLVGTNALTGVKLATSEKAQ